MLEIDYKLSRLGKGYLRQSKNESSNKQKPIPHNRSTIQRQSNTIYLTLSHFKASKAPLVPLVALVPSAEGKVRSANLPPVNCHADHQSALILLPHQH